VSAIAGSPVGRSSSIGGRSWSVEKPFDSGSPWPAARPTARR
jgi:hypothetical protein